MSSPDDPPKVNKGFGAEVRKFGERATDALLRDMPTIRDPEIDIERDSVRVFIPRTKTKIRFRIMADPDLKPDDARELWDDFISQPERSTRAMVLHGIVVVSEPPEKERELLSGSTNTTPENDQGVGRIATPQIVAREYGLTYKEYTDAFFLAQNTLLNNLKRA